MGIVPRRTRFEVEFSDDYREVRVVTCIDTSDVEELCPDLARHIKATTVQLSMSTLNQYQGRVREEGRWICIEYRAPRRVGISALLETFVLWVSELMDVESYREEIKKKCRRLRDTLERARVAKIIYAQQTGELS